MRRLATERKLLVARSKHICSSQAALDQESFDGKIRYFQLVFDGSQNFILPLHDRISKIDPDDRDLEAETPQLSVSRSVKTENLADDASFDNNQDLNYQAANQKLKQGLELE